MEKIEELAEIGIGLAKIMHEVEGKASGLKIYYQKEDLPFCQKGYRLSVQKDGEEIAVKNECLLTAINEMIERLQKMEYTENDLKPQWDWWHRRLYEYLDKKSDAELTEAERDFCKNMYHLEETACDYQNHREDFE